MFPLKHGRSSPFQRDSQYPFLPLSPFLLPAAFLPSLYSQISWNKSLYWPCLYLYFAWVTSWQSEEWTGFGRCGSEFRLYHTYDNLHLLITQYGALSKLLDFSKSLFSHLWSGHIYPPCKNTWPHCNAQYSSELFLELAESLIHCSKQNKTPPRL